MQIGSGPATKKQAETFGAYFLDLKKNQSQWMRRQVETVKSIKPSVQEVSHSFDLDLTKIIKAARAHRIEVGESVLVPLLSVPKSRLFDIDTRDNLGRPLNILKRNENSFLTHAAWLKSRIDSKLRTTNEESLGSYEGFSSVNGWPYASVHGSIPEMPGTERELEHERQLQNIGLSGPPISAATTWLPLFRSAR